MRDRILAELARYSTVATSRRGSLTALGGATLSATLSGLSLVEAKKKGKNARKRKRRRKNQIAPAPGPTCNEQCFPEFDLCFVRPEGAPLCANGADTGGQTPCTTDQDCIGDPVGPYCLVDVTDQVTSTPDRFTTCEPYAVGCCISVVN